MFTLNSAVVTRTSRAAAMVLVIFAGAATASAANTAETYGYKQDPTTKLPTKATTEFFLPAWTDVDPLNTAQHELFHAVGFTSGYTKFNDHVTVEDGKRKLKGDDGTLLALLKLDSNHVDPDAGKVRGRDQKESIMRPDQVKDQRLIQWDADLLNACYGWDKLNIKITPKYEGNAWNETRKGYVVQAIADVQKLFGSDGTGSAFEWTVIVNQAPAPGAAGLLIAGGVLATRRRRA